MCRDVFSNVVEVLSVSVVISLILLDEKDKDGDEVYEKEMWSSTLYMHYNLIIVTNFDIA
jgi:hypothetical protein